MRTHHLKVVPEQISAFYMKQAVTTEAMSILNGLRESVYMQDEDTVLSKVGYFLDTMMNTTYICLIYTLVREGAHPFLTTLSVQPTAS